MATASGFGTWVFSTPAPASTSENSMFAAGRLPGPAAPISPGRVAVMLLNAAPYDPGSSDLQSRPAGGSDVNPELPV